MRKLRILMPLFFLGCFSNLSAQVWTAKANYGGTARNRAVAFSVSSLGKGYFVGGYDFNYQQDVWEYDTLANSWTQKANFPGAPTVAVAFPIGDKGYVGTGVGGGYSWTDSFYEYDPLANTWTAKANFPGGARGYGVGFSIGGKGYLGGGFTGIAGSFISFNDFYEYDPVTDTWNAIAPYPGLGAALGASGFSIADKGYVGCGSSIDAAGNQTLHNDFWEYDSNNNSWTQKADYAGGVRGEAASFSICDKGYIGLGYDVPHATFSNEFWEYDPISDSWTAVANYGGVARAYAPAFSVGKSGYAGTGSDGIINYNDFWEYHKIYVADFVALPTTVCQGNTVSFTDQSSFVATGWLWDFPGGTPSSSNIQNPTITYDLPGTFSVTLLAYNNCDSDTITQLNYITVIPSPIQPDLGNDTTFCSNFLLQLNAGSSGFSYLWSTSDTSATIFFSDTGTYWLQVSNQCDTLTDSITIQQQTFPAVFLGNDTLYCDDFTLTLDADSLGSSYQWSTGDVTQTIAIDSAGTYWVKVSNSCGVASDTIIIMQTTAPVADLGSDTSLCDFSDFLLAAETGVDTYIWSTGETTAAISIVVPGLYWVNIINGCGAASDSVLIEQCQGDYLVPTGFTPNGDGLNDEISLIKIGDASLIDFSIFNRWGQKIFVITDETASWNGTYMNKLQNIGVYVYFLRFRDESSGTEILKKGNITLIR